MKLSQARNALARVTINLRSHPGVGFASVGIIEQDEQVLVQEYESDDAGNMWFKYKDGWIAGRYLDFTIKHVKTNKDDMLSLGLHEDEIGVSGSTTVDTSAGINYEQSGDSITVTGDSQTPNTTSNKQNGANWGGLATNVMKGLFGDSLESVMGGDQTGTLGQRLFGVPFQFISSTDIRPTSGGISQAIGTAFSDNILAEAPILNLLAGSPDYLPDMDAKTRKDTIKTLADAIGNNIELAQQQAQALVEEGKGDTRFFEFKEANSDYMMYVNTMCRSLAIFMGIGSSIVPGTSETYSTYNWSNYTLLNTFGGSSSDAGTSATGGVGMAAKLYDTLFNKGEDSTNNPMSTGQLGGDSNYGQWHAKLASGKDAQTQVNGLAGKLQEFRKWSSAAISKKQSFVSFYIKPPSYNESFTNTTQGSAFKDLIKGISQSTKELAFLLHSAGAGEIAINNAASASVSINKSVDQLATTGALSTVYKRLLRGASTVLTGGNLIFPDIWTESGYERNFNIDIHLSTPYGTPESIFLEIMVPMAHIMALCLPRQSDGGANAYTTPFMVRANVPGFFTCDMGMVRSCTIQKGGNGDGWSYMGFPTEMDISLSIVDLYNTMAMSTMDSVTNIYNFMWNTQFVDWLATNSGGVDMTTPFLDKKIQMMTALITNVPSDIYANAKMKLREAIRAGSIGIFKG